MKIEMTWLVLAVSYLFLFHGLCLVFLVFFFKTRDFFSFFFPFSSLYSYQKDESC